MTIIEAIIQGIVQGATEFLPISSSGHLSLTQHILGVEVENLFFGIMLHIGTLVAVIMVYYKLILRLIGEFFIMLKDVVTGKFKWKTMSHDRRLVMMLIIGLLPLFLLFVPIPIIGLNLSDLSTIWATDNNLLIEGMALLLTSLLLFIAIKAGKNAQRNFEKRQGSDMPGRKNFNTVDALCVGFAQCMAAVFPGLSRSGSTLSTAMMRGINKQKALDYSFVLGSPAILAAAVLSIRDVSSEPLTIGYEVLAAGFISAVLVGFLAIKLFKWLVSSDRLYIFAIYTLVVGVATIVVSIIEFTLGINLFTGVAL